MNMFYGLTTPAADGVGAASDVSASGKTKTFTITGTMVGTVTVEASNDGTGYFPVFSIAKPGKKTVELPCQWLRVRISGYQSGQAAVDVSATDEGVKLANLPVSAGDGNGAAVDVSDFGTCNSLLVSGVWTGVVTIEISEDGLVWNQIEGFSANGLRVRNFVTNYMRVHRSGNSTGTPNVDVAASNDDNPETNLFGDGSDGDVTLVAPLTLTRDMYYDTLDVADQHVDTAGFRIFCKTELRIAASGLIQRDGNPGVAEAAGAALPVAMLGNSAAGGAGATGAGAAGGALAQCVGGEGGAGGAGTGGAGGAAGVKTACTATEPHPQALPGALTGLYYTPGAAPDVLKGGTGGGGGGGDSAADEGGGGGGGGGVILIAARKINLQVTSAQITALGGDGAAGTAADCGGGGGGGGGAIILTYRAINNQGTISANGGDGGASGGGTGVAGSAGDAGSIYYNQV